MTEAVCYAALSPETVSRYPTDEMLVSGDPRQKVQIYFSHEGGRLRSGVWESEVGAYRVQFGPTKHEFFQLTEGRVRIHAASGSVTEYAAGENCVIPANFSGVFEIVEKARKHFVISE